MSKDIRKDTMSQEIEEKLHNDGDKLEDTKGGNVETINKSAKERALVRKIDLYLMPSIWFLYLLAVSILRIYFESLSDQFDSTWTARTLATPKLLAWKTH